MDKVISAADANRNFSKLLREVREGHSYVITNHGRPVARIIPAYDHVESEGHGRAALLERLRSEPVVNIGPWSRHESYEDGL
jgi:prevent-host-death family protein